MKTSHKNLLKSILLTSIAAVGTNPAQASEVRPMVAISKNEHGQDSDNSSFLERLSSGVLASYTAPSEIEGHSSHSSHSSHTSHTSSSGYGGGYGGSSGGSGSGAAVGATLGAVAGGVAIYYIVKAICKSVKKHKANKAMKYGYVGSVSSYSSSSTNYTPIKREYASRDLEGGMIGTDVDEMIDSLIANGVLTRAELQKSRNPYNYKYNSSVKRSVKRMHIRMGKPKSKVASKAFLSDLKSWRKRKDNYSALINANDLNIEQNKEALTAVAILLVEKGFLKSYDIENIMDVDMRTKILRAFHKFQQNVGIPESSIINIETLAKLYSLPTVQ